MNGGDGGKLKNMSSWVTPETLGIGYWTSQEMDRTGLRWDLSSNLSKTERLATKEVHWCELNLSRHVNIEGEDDNS